MTAGGRLHSHNIVATLCDHMEDKLSRLDKDSIKHYYHLIIVEFEDLIQ